MVDDCIFCRVVSGETGATFLYEDEFCVAFDDLSPQAPVHTLIVPRDHYRNLNDDIPVEVRAALLAAVPKVARVKGVADTGYRLIINNGDDANQTVQHLHIHLMGGREMAHGMVQFAST